MDDKDYRGVLGGFNATRSYRIVPEEKDITVIDALEKKLQLQADLLERIQQFEGETGLMVSSVELYAENEEEFTAAIEVQVCL